MYASYTHIFKRELLSAHHQYDNIRASICAREINFSLNNMYNILYKYIFYTKLSRE